MRIYLFVLRFVLMLFFMGMSTYSNAQHIPLTTDEVFTQASGHPLSGTYESPWFVGSPWCDPRAYGAKGDGTHDDTAAIQTCIDNASNYRGAERNGGVVFLAPGAYKITSTLFLPTAGATAGYIQNVSLIGSGALNTELNCSVGSNPCIKVQQNKEFKISDLTLINTCASGSGVGMWLTGPSFGTQTAAAIIENVNAYQFGTCFWIGDSSTGAASSEVLWQNDSGVLCSTGWRIEAANSLNQNFVLTGCAGCGIGFDVIDANAVYWRGGWFTNSTIADFKLEGPSGVYSIQDVRSEGANRFLMFGPSSCGVNQQVTLKSNSMTASSNSDGYVIENYGGGASQLTLIGNSIAGKISPGPGATCMLSFTAIGNTIADSVLFRVNGTALATMWYSSRGNLQINSNLTGLGSFPQDEGVVLVNTSTITPVATISDSWNPHLTLRMSTYSGLGSPANGTIVPCVDCAATKPCSGGGTGALAKRFSGVWVCN